MNHKFLIRRWPDIWKLFSKITMKAFCQILVVSFLLTSSACKKDGPAFSLTPASQVGANTLSFKVNGRVWQPSGRRCVGAGVCVDEPLAAYYDAKSGKFQLRAFLTTKSIAEDFSLYADLQRPTLAKRLYFAQARQYGDPTYHTTDSTRTILKITHLDTTAHVVSGTFEGFLESQFRQPLTATITEGRFDVKY